PEEAPGFREGGEDEVGVALRQEGEAALGPPEEPLPPQLAGADGDLGLDHVPGAAERIARGVDVDEQPLALVVAQEEPEGRQGPEPGAGQDAEIPPAGAADHD